MKKEFENSEKFVFYAVKEKPFGIGMTAKPISKGGFSPYDITGYFYNDEFKMYGDFIIHTHFQNVEDAYSEIERIRKSSGCPHQ